jgi:hypothetical protein
MMMTSSKPIAIVVTLTNHVTPPLEIVILDRASQHPYDFFY